MCQLKTLNHNPSKLGNLLTLTTLSTYEYGARMLTSNTELTKLLELLIPPSVLFRAFRVRK